MTRTAQEEANLKLVLDMFENVLIPFDSGAVDRFIDEDYIQHSQLAPPGRDALKAFLDTVKEQSPQGEHRILRAFVDEDHVTVHYHVIRWPGDPGFVVMDIFRIENGKIKEHWDVMQDVVEGGPNPNSQF